MFISDKTGALRATALKRLVSVLSVKREQVWEQIVREEVLNKDEEHESRYAWFQASAAK